jgi:hypothetical protein
MEVIYYESHVTVEPVFDSRLETFRSIAATYRFRVADLFMQRERKDTPERSSKDSFCTGRSKSFEEIKTNMDALANDLQRSGIQVWRKKIEAVVYDERLRNPAA